MIGKSFNYLIYRTLNKSEQTFKRAQNLICFIRQQCQLILSSSGQTFIEILIAVFIFVILVITLIGIAVLGTRTVLVSEQRTVAQAIANEKVEILKLTPYDDVGITGGTPDGVFPATQTLTRNNQDYTVTTVVELVDDPLNGCLAGSAPSCDTSGLTEADADYKNVIIKVAYPGTQNQVQDVVLANISTTGQAQSLLSPIQCNANDTTGACPIGKRCCDQFCIPDCEEGNCLDGYVCAIDGCGCVPRECSSDFECGYGEICRRHQCTPLPCADNNDCLVVDELTCVEGQCTAATCYDDGDCVSPMTCNLGTNKCDLFAANCIPPSNCTCSSPLNCPAGVNGFKCSALNDCEPADCNADFECALAGQQCLEGKCADLCTDNSDCPLTQTCVYGYCEISCLADDDCGGGYTCQGDICKPPVCEKSNDCPDGYDCTDFHCRPIKCTGVSDCPSNFECINGGCLPLPCDPGQCPESYLCSGASCILPAPPAEPPVLGTECPAPIAFACLPAIGQVTISWQPIASTMLCRPVITVTECSTDIGPVWSDTDGDNITNCGIPGGPIINACPDRNPLECGTNCTSGCVSCSATNEICLAGRCVPNWNLGPDSCPGGFVQNPDDPNTCVEEYPLIPNIVCPATCPGDSYCSGGQCVTPGCENDQQCGFSQMCEKRVCHGDGKDACADCIPEDRAQYCYGFDAVGCTAPGVSCNDPLHLGTGTCEWRRDKYTGCNYLGCKLSPTQCGNLIIQPGEDCEGPGSPTCPTGDICQPDTCTCPAPSCGNNIVEEGEDCDGTDDTACPGQCGINSACQCPFGPYLPTCGNGLLDPGEQCDTNTYPDGCAVNQYCDYYDCQCYDETTSSPEPECGDGIIDTVNGEQCDPEALPTTGCTGGQYCEAYNCQCYPAPGTCGNGVIDFGEACDPGRTPDNCPANNYCSVADCQCYAEPTQTPAPICGNGVIEQSEQCDWAATPDGCSGTETCYMDCFCFQ